MEKQKKNNKSLPKHLDYTKEEMIEIHKALYNKRRKFINVKDKKYEISSFNDLRQIKTRNIIFSQFDSGNAKATIAIKSNVPIHFWNVITDTEVFKNKHKFAREN